MLFKKAQSAPPPEGFTLAEVLITLGIIGIVAALTIPNLTKHYRDKAIISGVKQAYSILGNASHFSYQSISNLAVGSNFRSFY